MYSISDNISSFDLTHESEDLKKLLNNTIDYMSYNCSDILIKSFVNSSFD